MKNDRVRMYAAGVVSSLLSASVPAAQAAPPPAYAEPLAYELEVPTLVNRGLSEALLDTREIAVAGAPALRLFFQELDLGPKGRLVVSSLADGQVQNLTAAEAIKWSGSTAYFNGSRLLLELYAGPGERASYRTSHVLKGLPPTPADTICGNDDKLPILDNRSGRILDSGGGAQCTGWLLDNDCALTAGHCAGLTSVLEFNVPQSFPSGAVQHPPVEDQFPVTAGSMLAQNGGLGNDWAVYSLQANGLGELPYLKFGFHELGFFFAGSGDSIRITGFGTDIGTTNQTEQTDAGPYVATSGTSITYAADTTGGNSGSPVLHEATGKAIGIHTNGGCSFGGGANSGTSTANLNFQNAYYSSCNPSAPQADFTAANPTVTVGQTVQFIDTSSGPPTSWAWDVDADGQTDTTTKNPTFIYLVPGTFDVKLSVANALGTSSVTKPGFIHVNPVIAAAVPYAQIFSGGLPGGGEWVFTGDNASSSITAGGFGTPSPSSGDPALIMASKDDGVYVTNQSILHLDLSGIAQSSLSFWWKQTNEENDPQDGVFFASGAAAVQAFSFNNGPSAWTQVTLDLDQIASAGGLALGSDFRVTFQQRDNYTIGTDGILIDDVAVTVQDKLAGAPTSISVSAGGTQSFALDAGVANRYHLYLLLGTLGGTTPGIDLGGIHLPLNSDGYTNFTLANPNNLLLSNSLEYLDGIGQGSAALNLPAGSAGSLAGLKAHHAYLLFDLTTSGTGTGAVTLASNPVSLDLLP